MHIGRNMGVYRSDDESNSAHHKRSFNRLRHGHRATSQQSARAAIGFNRNGERGGVRNVAKG